MKFDLKEVELENGLRVVQARVPTGDVTIFARVKAGPLYEPESLAGLSHFCEHVILKGTKKRPSNEAILLESDRMGGRRWAFTSKEEVVFGHRVVLDDFHKGLDWVSDLLYSAVFSDVDVETEKGVVLDELRLENDDPALRLQRKELDRVMFKGSELEKSILGTGETIKSYSPKQARAFYGEYFKPSNTTLLIAGPHDFSELVSAVNKYLGVFPKGEMKKSPAIKPENKQRIVNLQQKLDSVYLLFGRFVSASGIDESCAAGILGTVLNRKIFDRVSDKEGGSYTCFAWYDYESCLYGRLLISATCAPDKYERVKKLVFEELEKLKKGDFSDELIRDQITYAKKSFIFNNDTTENVAQSLLKFHKAGNVYEINERIPALNKLTPEAVREAAAKHISLDDLTIVSLGNLD